MKDCHEYFKQRHINVNFKALYIEKDKFAYEKLETFTENMQLPGVNVHTKRGDFYTLREEILNWCGDKDFTFFFIDPTGWKNVVEPETLQPILKRSHSEFLINFMFDFVLRAHSQVEHRRSMIDIFDKVPNTNGMNPKEREKYLLELYLSALKNSLSHSGNRPRLAYVKILDPIKDRTKYDLVYLTRHPLGVKVFMEESEKLDLFQKKVRARIKQEQHIEKTKQNLLFAADINVDESNIDLDKVKRYWLDKLTYRPKRFGIEQLADMHEETGWFKGDIQRAFNELLREGKVINTDAKRKRPVNAVHVEKGDRLRKVKP